MAQTIFQSINGRVWTNRVSGNDSDYQPNRTGVYYNGELYKTCRTQEEACELAEELVQNGMAAAEELRIGHKPYILF